jgi:hypothetical protein
MAALINYRRLLPDLLDDSHKPINGSYLADLDALFRGYSLGNSGRVAEQMVFALVRALHSFVDQYEDIITFLETTLDRERPLLQVFDGFSDQYLRRRINGQSHEAARVELSRIKMPELRGDDDQDWVNVTHQGELSLQELHLQDHSQSPYIASCGDRVCPCCIACSYLFVLTYIEVPWSSLKATIPLRLVSLIQSKYPPRLELLKKT